MPSWQGKSKGTPLGYRIFVWVIKSFGVKPAYFLLRFVALYYFFFSYKSSKLTYHYFRHKHGFNRVKAIIGIYTNYYLFGESLIDKMVVMADIPNKFTFNFDGEQHLREMTALKGGGLLLSAHLGNWEVAGHLLKRLETRINIVMFDGEHEKIKQYLTSVTGERKVNVIVIRDDLSHIYQISDAFSNNELVCMHADRFLEGNKTLTANFLGHQAHFPMGPFVLAAKFKVPVSFVFAMKENRLHYHFFATEGKIYETRAKSTGLQGILEEFVGQMQEKVKKYPHQWYNYYNFWKN